ncbi:hypothetical protein QBC33DRAFT_585585 [Phialemonium atrogriseum]|uniref:Uncharacterized protein n=1 Tax=Phialemonium atrogriseum TaxID=1093897 RepID=A0AAJ0C0F5_9PEZI|nr:uncharacterized protein QBC33DRAFT_585585 [Phialemonium atrogriseum]KAK1767665.1 hypothetical protein QBC33DRAFT_585585 [Phialemonium atrogriseum]
MYFDKAYYWLLSSGVEVQNNAWEAFAMCLHGRAPNIQRALVQELPSMPDKNKKSSKSLRGLGKGEKGSRGKGGGQAPRDTVLDQQRFEELAMLVYERQNLEAEYSTAVMNLATRMRGNEAAEELYEHMINWISDPYESRQTDDANREVQDYQDLNRALSMQRGIAAIPASLDQFAADQQDMVRDIARIQRQLANIIRSITTLRLWLNFSGDEYSKPSDFDNTRRDDEDPDNGGGTLPGGEEWAPDLGAGVDQQLYYN